MFYLYQHMVSLWWTGIGNNKAKILSSNTITSLMYVQMYIETKTMMSASRWSSKCWSLISLFVWVWLKLRECLEKVCEEVQKRGAQMCFTEFDTVFRCKSGTSDRRNFIYWYSLSLLANNVPGLQLKCKVS